jgi:ribosome maturation factor RimP
MGLMTAMEVEAMVRPVIEAAGLELVEVGFRREQGHRILRVTVDRDGGIDLDSVAEISERISRRLDFEGFEPGPYHLEVSSPGVERPLKEPRHFATRVGERVKVRTAQPVEGARTHVGTIVATDARTVRLGTDTGERTIAFDQITSARTVFEWGPGKEGGGRR